MTALSHKADLHGDNSVVARVIKKEISYLSEVCTLHIKTNILLNKQVVFFYVKYASLLNFGRIMDRVMLSLFIMACGFVIIQGKSERV